MLEIVEVKTGKDFRNFLKFPQELYSDVLGDKRYVMPLMAITRIQIGSYKNPNIKMLLAMDSMKVIARLGVKKHGHGIHEKLHFGFFESLPNRPDIVQALFDYAQNLFPHLQLIGPYNFRMEDPYMGVLVDGHQHHPYFLMSYNPDYYQSYFEKMGFHSEMDVLAYDVKHDQKLPESLYQKASESEMAGFRVRWMTARSMKKDVQSIARIFNDALADNWGFEALNKSQLNEMYLMFKFFIEPDLVSFVQKDGKDVACLIMIPNYNALLKQVNGHLTFRLVWDLLFKRHKPDSIRGYALGVLKSYHQQGLGSLLVTKTWDKCVQHRGMKNAEISWVLANNESMNKLTLQMGGKPNRRYRVYSRPALVPPLKESL